MGSSTRNPKINIQLLAAGLPQTIEGRRDLIIGQLGASATATSGALELNVQDLTLAQVATKFGASTDLYYKIKNFRDGNDRVSQLDVIGLDPNGSGVAAASSIQVTGTATADSTLTVTVVDETEWSFDVSITSGDANTVVSAAINTAAGLLTAPVFTSGVSTDTVTFTAVDVGTIPNAYGLKIEGDTPGLTYTVTGWASGANDPTTTGVLDPISGIRYNGLHWPETWYSDIDTPIDVFDTRFNTANEIMDGVVFTGKTDTFANSKAAALAQNSQSLVLWGNAKLNLASIKGPAIMQPADWSCCYFMGVRSKRLSDGSLISSDVTTLAPLDAFGGIGLASLPYFNTPLRNAPITATTYLFDNTEQEELEESGFTAFGVNKANNLMITGPVVTTWTTDSSGSPNTSFLWLNNVDTASVCREYIFNNLFADFSQTRLTEGDLVAGISMTNAGDIKAKLLKYYKQLSAVGLVQAGSDAEKNFSQKTVVTVDLAAGSVTIYGPLTIVTAARRFDYSLSLSFSIS